MTGPVESVVLEEQQLLGVESEFTEATLQLLLKTLLGAVDCVFFSGTAAHVEVPRHRRNKDGVSDAEYDELWFQVPDRVAKASLTFGMISRTGCLFALQPGVQTRSTV